MQHDVAVYPQNIIGLCAGSGGLDLAVRIASPAARSICYVERDASAAASLVASMEAGRLHQAPIWSDLSTFDAKAWRGVVDIVTSGDPCQPNSVAGKREGSRDDRFLIEQVLRVVDECRPHRLFRENVPGNADGQLEAIVPPLEAMGYRVAAGIFSSKETGNSQVRERLFIMADQVGQGQILGSAYSENPQRQQPDKRNSERWAQPNGSVGLPSGAGFRCFVPGPDDDEWKAIIEQRPEYRPANNKQEAQSLLRRGFDAVANRVERLRHCGNGVDPLAGAYAYLSLAALQAQAG